MNIEQTVSAYIRQHGLLTKEGRYVVALSGGADSVCLLLILLQLGYRVEAAHCNFRLRGAESDRDEAFVVALCNRHQVPLHRIHFDTQEYAALHHVSIEMAARELRYHWFEQLLKDIPADGICVAHHRDDSVETVLLNLVRGTGIHGLCGIQPRNGHVLRPLLCVSRKEIEAWMQNRGQDYMTYSTNLIPDVHRNQIRLQVLPLLRQINPSVAESILLTASRLADAAAIYDTAVKEAKERCTNTLSNGMVTIDKEKLTNESILFEILKDYQFTPDQAEQIFQHLDAPTGTHYASKTHELSLDRSQLVIAPHFHPSSPLRIPETGTYIYQPEADKNRTIKFRIVAKDEVTVSKQPTCITVDADKVRFPLTVRPTATGDRFQPFGMKGSCLVSDYLTDRKVSYPEKQRQLVMTGAQGDILWLVGRRVAASAAVTSCTQRILEIAVSDDF